VRLIKPEYLNKEKDIFIDKKDPYKVYIFVPYDLTG
jgi:hypothetical protein